jgi:Retrotransposon gag protein
MSESNFLEEHKALILEVQRLRAGLDLQTVRAETALLEAQAARARAEAAAVKAQAPDPKDKAKLGTPSNYNGHVGVNAQTWINSMEAYMRLCETPESKWPGVAGSYMKDTAEEWHSAFYLQNSGVSWEDYKAAFLSRFRPVDSNRIGRSQLMDLKMKASDRGSGILQYVNRFMRLVNQVNDITENEKFTYFNQGLTPELRRLLIPLTNINTVDDAISMVVRYEMLTQQDRASSDRSNYKGMNSQGVNRKVESGWNPNNKFELNMKNSPIPNTSNSMGGTTPMELGSMEQSEDTSNNSEELNAMRGGGRGRLTSQQVEEHRKKGLCFSCHKQGHIRINCPLNQSARG